MFPFPAAAAALAALAFATAASTQEMPRFDPLEAFEVQALTGAGGALVAQFGSSFLCGLVEDFEDHGIPSLVACRPVMTAERMDAIRAARAAEFAARIKETFAADPSGLLPP